MGTESTEREAAGGEGRDLRNGAYAVRLTPRGTGWSALGDRLVTSGAPYPERDGGVWIYVRDVESGDWWPAGVHRATRRPDRYGVGLEGSPARLRRVDGDVATTLEVAVPAEAAGELRRLTLANHGGRRRTLEVTTAAPLALDHAAAYAGHPAFSKLFVQTEYHADTGTLLARRRPRSPGDEPVSAVHRLLMEGPHRAPASGPPDAGETAWETDRARFLGRGRDASRPAALDPGQALSGTVGSVLDPVLSLRRRVALEPGASATLTAVLAAGETPERAGAAADAAVVAAGTVAWRGDHASPDEERRGAALVAEVFGPDRGPMGASPGGGGDVGATDVGGTAGDGTGELMFFNGIGGFAAGGDEYVIRLPPGTAGPARPPLPWINVVANASVGFLASESGAGYTWAGNSRLNRLTPWFNDPVTDPHGEAFYLRDEDDGSYWSPMPGPAPGPGPYEARHGFGYSRWRHGSHGVDQESWQLVAEEDPVKLVLLRVVNRSARRRRLSAYAYIEWVLGAGAEARCAVQARVAADGLVLARNPTTEDFEDAVGFAAAVGPAGGIGATTARAAFVGLHGTLAAPAALARGDLQGGPPGSASGGDGASGDGASGDGAGGGRSGDVGDASCAAFRVPLDLGAGETAVCAFVLGQAGSESAARELAERYGTTAAVEAELGRVRDGWRARLGAVVVETPSPALDLMLNGWLLYQDLACRIRGRSAFYQSGGAYGYRDQLQDVTGLIYHEPELAREQILLHAAHQFPEGDVLHWWHPPAGRGIRTRFSDDLLWLPYVLGFYLDVTGDAAILDEEAPFVEGPLLEPGEDERYMRPARSAVSAAVYEHACRAIDRSLTRGAHGLPLMGTGDWNDGMNRVGREGRGESVWLGFFLAAILRRWIPLCRSREDAARTASYRDYLAGLEAALDDAGWDGEWYRRAFYDDGDPLGSHESDECRIDAIAQAWSVLSGVAPAERAERALDALEARLVDDDAGIVRLLTPPFDRTPHDPGYIKGYVPGVRENGGQYTHGVLWAIRAMAEAGRTERAAPLLEMLLPVSHARTPEEVDRYKVEPYVVAADVYGAPPHVGRGGWTWYTGSAAWMYRVALESVLGFGIRDRTRLRLAPCIPAAWPGYRIDYRRPDGATTYRIDVRRTDGPGTTAVLDGEPVVVRGGVSEIELVDDGGSHRLDVQLGADATPRYAPAS